MMFFFFSVTNSGNETDHKRQVGCALRCKLRYSYRRGDGGGGGDGSHLEYAGHRRDSNHQREEEVVRELHQLMVGRPVETNA